MIEYSDCFETIASKNAYFAGANTPSGFVCEYPNIFSEDRFSKVYAVKGGSGTGKSTLIRKLAEAGEKAGGDVEYLLCSSDPESLDGAVISKGDKRIAVIDATAPHVYDPAYPGACGEIIDCGAFWNSAILEADKDRIAELIKKKSECYKLAYKYLASAKEIFEMQQSLAKGCFMKNKAEGAAERLVKTFGGKGEGRVTVRRTAAVSMKGAVRLSTFENAKTLIGVADFGLVYPLFTELLLSVLSKNECDVTVSVSPVFGILEMYLPKTDTAIVPLREGVLYEKVINLKRFAEKSVLSESKQRRAFSKKCLKAVMEGATENLALAGEVHFELEKKYIRAMDFEGLGESSRRLCERIEKRLL